MPAQEKVAMVRDWLAQHHPYATVTETITAGALSLQVRADTWDHRRRVTNELANLLGLPQPQVYRGGIYATPDAADAAVWTEVV